MLEFIVLGQVPGTGIVLTFSWVVAASTVLVGVSLLYAVRSHRNFTPLLNIEDIAL